MLDSLYSKDITVAARALWTIGLDSRVREMLINKHNQCRANVGLGPVVNSEPWGLNTNFSGRFFRFCTFRNGTPTLKISLEFGIKGWPEFAEVWLTVANQRAATSPDGKAGTWEKIWPWAGNRGLSDHPSKINNNKQKSAWTCGVMRNNTTATPEIHVSLVSNAVIIHR